MRELLVRLRECEKILLENRDLKCREESAMEKNILVSVIVPVHNTQEYLRECIESIRNQTLTQIEIILVDENLEKLEDTKQ